MNSGDEYQLQPNYMLIMCGFFLKTVLVCRKLNLPNFATVVVRHIRDHDDKAETPVSEKAVLTVEQGAKDYEHSRNIPAVHANETIITV